MSGSTKKTDLSGDAKRSTLASIVRFLGWIALGVMAGVTAGHAVSITLAWTQLDPTSGDIIAILAILGIVLVEVFAIFTAIRYATHDIRAKQTPVGMFIEGVWFVFAAINLIASFAIKHGGEMPGFVGVWVVYGLPVTGLFVAALYYIMNRLDPDASRADEEAELRETFRANEHEAKVQVLNSEAMKMVLQQAMWQTLPEQIGRELGLSQSQIDNLIRHAPQLIDPRDSERSASSGPRVVPPTPPQLTAADVDALLALARPTSGVGNSAYAPGDTQPPPGYHAPGQGEGNGAPPPVYGADTRRP